MGNVLKLPRNEKGRDFIVGDIHGAFALLDAALERVKFDPEKDRLISVGDLVDRGLDSPRCLEFLAKPWFHAVRGNHEDMFLDIWHDAVPDLETAKFHIKNNGARWQAFQTPETLRAIEKAFRDLPVAIEIETAQGLCGIVHAEVPAGLDWAAFKQKLEDNDADVIAVAQWGRKRIRELDAAGVAGVDRVFHGHTPQPNGPTRLGNCFYIDTGAVYGQLTGDPSVFLTLVDIESKAIDRAPTPLPPKPKKKEAEEGG